MVLPICATDSHTDGWGGGEAVTGGYSDVVMSDSHLSTTCTAAASDDDIYFLEGEDGEGGSSPPTSPSQAMVWDCLHLPLAAPADPPR